MKRIALVAVAAALFASTAAIAFADDTENENDIDETSETRELNETQMWKAEMIADYMDEVLAEWLDPEPLEPAPLEPPPPTSLEQVIELRTGDTVVGWGAMFKLIQLADLGEQTLAELLADIDGDDEGWAFGKRFKELKDNGAESDEDAPKNLGQLKKQDKANKTNNGKKSG
jgi:hypothetical protein